MFMSAADIIAKIPSQYREAKEGGDLFFFPSTLVRHREPDTNIEVGIRLRPETRRMILTFRLKLSVPNKRLSGTEEQTTADRVTFRTN